MYRLSIAGVFGLYAEGGPLIERVLRVVAAGMLAVFAAGHAAAQQAYPARQVRVIVPFPPGGSNDVVARLVSQKLTEIWGQQVLIDNRPGGNTIIGSEALIKSPPDGYTLMLTSSAHVITPLLIPTPYDALKDFGPVATLAISENILVIHPSLPAYNLRQFIALAKARPGQINYASSGAGSPSHLATASFELLAGIRMQHVPYKGGGPAIIDLIGGHVQLHFNTPITLAPHIKTGKLRALAITGGSRFPALPQLPTFSEAGLPAFDLKTWFGVFVPVATPREVIDKLSADIAKMLALPDFRQTLDGLGMAPLVSTPDKFAALMKSDTTILAKVIKAGNIKLEQ